MFQCHKCGKDGLRSIVTVDGLPTCTYCLPPVCNTYPITLGPYMGMGGGSTIQPLIQDYSLALGQITNELKEIRKLLELIGTRIG